METTWGTQRSLASIELKPKLGALSKQTGQPSADRFI
jgi:hypothetical protein